MVKILIADDEPHVRRLIRQSLEELEDSGVEILEANDGEEALEIIHRERPQLAFLDIIMGDVNGFYVCDTVKREWHLDTYVVLVTAKLEGFNRERGMRAGADAYITKPFEPDDILDRAAEALGKSLCHGQQFLPV